jgi:hypothetical protein
MALFTELSSGIIYNKIVGFITVFSVEYLFKQAFRSPCCTVKPVEIQIVASDARDFIFMRQTQIRL